MLDHLQRVQVRDGRRLRPLTCSQCHDARHFASRRIESVGHGQLSLPDSSSSFGWALSSSKVAPLIRSRTRRSSALVRSSETAKWRSTITVLSVVILSIRITSHMPVSQTDKVASNPSVERPTFALCAGGSINSLLISERCILINGSFALSSASTLLNQAKKCSTILLTSRAARPSTQGRHIAVGC